MGEGDVSMSLVWEKEGGDVIYIGVILTFKFKILGVGAG